MSAQLHPQLLHGRNLSIPPDQQKVLDSQTDVRNHGPPDHDVPAAVLESLIAYYAGREQRRKRDAHEASLTLETRASKTAKRDQSIHGGLDPPPIHGSSPLTPVAARKATVPPTSSPTTAISWSPSPDRTKAAPQPTRPAPSKLPAPSFPSSAPEEPLEVDLPKAQTAVLPSTSQADTPLLRQKARGTDTPPCGQASPTTQEKKPPKPVNRFKDITFSHLSLDLSVDSNEDDHPPPLHRHSKRASPYRSSLLPSSNMPEVSTHPPPGQTVPNPQWPAPYQRSPREATKFASSSAASQDFASSTQREASQLNLSNTPLPMAQTMSYVSPDMASQPEAQQLQPSPVHVSLEASLGTETPHVQDPQSSAVADQVSQALIPRTVLSAAKNHHTNGGQEELQQTTVEPQHAGQQSPTSQEEPSAARVPQTVEPVVQSRGVQTITEGSSSPAVTSKGHSAHDQPNAKVAPIAEVGTAGNSQDASTTSSASAIPATQQPDKLSISFDDKTSPFDAFCKVYPAYSGSLQHFIKACICLEHMERMKTLHCSLWDDFVGVFPSYLAYVKSTRRNALVAAEWYNDREEDASFTKRLIGKQNLTGILGCFDAQVQEMQKRFHRSPQKPSCEPATAPPVSPINRNDDAPSRETPQSNGKGSDHTPTVIANTQPDYGEPSRAGKAPDEPPLRSVELEEGAKINKKELGETQELPRRRHSTNTPNGVVASTPCQKDSPALGIAASDPPKIAPQVHSRISKTETHHRHSTGNLPQNAPPQTAPSSSRPKSTLSRGKPVNAAKQVATYFARMDKGKSKNGKGDLKGLGRRNSSLSRSEAS